MTTSPGLITSTKYVISKEARWYVVPTILQLYRYFYYSNTLFDIHKATSRVCKPSLGSIPCQGLQVVGIRSEVCLQGVCKELEHTISYDEILDTLNIPKLEQRRKALKLCFMHKLVGTNAPVLHP